MYPKLKFKRQCREEVVIKLVLGKIYILYFNQLKRIKIIE